MAAQESGIYRFADCELDVREHRLLVHGQPVALTPKVFDTLRLLVERAGHVVSKDELMTALWPRGYVQESNLTKHIWLIRRALGDDDDGSHCIETVPKLGYRFTAPVCHIVASRGDGDASAMDLQSFGETPIERNPPGAPAIVAGGAGDQMPIDVARSAEIPAADVRLSAWHGEQAPIPPTLDRRRRDHGRWIAAALIAIAAVAAAGYSVYRARPPMAEREGPAAKPDPGAVAIVDFNNLSGNAKDGWVGPALEQMLATEVAVGGALHVVPEELVRQARTDLPPPGAGGYAPISLASLQRRLGAHFVLGGAYLVSGSADAPQLRIDLTVQDATNRRPLASLSRSAAVDELPHLVAQVGIDLRHRLGVETADAAVLRQTARVQPPSSEVARHVGFALQALHGNDPARARDELLQAIAQAPGYAPAYAYLARAWSMLGYRAKALAASRRALINAQGLPAEQFLQIQAQQFDLQADHGQAIAAYEHLVALRPRDPSYRFQLINAQLDAGKPQAAASALGALRTMTIDADDPRIELAAVRIASAQGDGAASIAHARRALEQARARAEPGLIASAELQLGAALNRETQSGSLLRRAAADFRRSANPHGEAQAWQNLGNLQFANDQIAPARETYQRAMAIYQGIGDLSGEAAIYDDLTRMLWSAGDRDGAEAALRQALQIGRETNDPVRQAWSLTGLATVLSDEASGDDVAAMYQQAIALDRQAGAQGHLAFALSTYADLLRGRGELDRAQGICTQALAAARALADPDSQAGVEVICAEIALDRGDVDPAAASLAEVAKKAAAAKDSVDAANAKLLLGQIAMGQQHWGDARALLQQSLQGWTANQEAAGQAVSEGLLALCYTSLGDVAARDRAVVHARELRSLVNQRAEVLPVDIALAEVQGMSGARDTAIAALQALADDADKRRWVGMALEARLAALDLQERGGDPAAARQAHDALATRARRLGFGWLEQRMALMRRSQRP